MKRKPETIRRVGLVANTDKAASQAAVRRAAALIARSGRSVLADEGTTRFAGLHCESPKTLAALARAVDLLVVFGGDGTMLRVLREINGARTPVVGINAGRLGFLTAVSPAQVPKALERLWANEFVVEERPLIEAAGQCLGQPTAIVALNDIVISHATVARLMELGVSVDGKPMTVYRGDGLIVSSPTGSTAYSLSAGGPIISPDAEVFVITPICAHALSNRSVVINLDSAVQVKLITPRTEAIVSADGQTQTKLMPGEVLEIRRSRRVARLLRPDGASFFDTVRRKLHWSGSSV